MKRAQVCYFLLCRFFKKTGTAVKMYAAAASKRCCCVSEHLIAEGISFIGKLLRYIDR